MSFSVCLERTSLNVSLFLTTMAGAGLINGGVRTTYYAPTLSIFMKIADIRQRIGYFRQKIILFHTRRTNNAESAAFFAAGFTYYLIRVIYLVGRRLDIVAAAIHGHKQFASNVLYAYHLSHKTKGIGNHRDARLKHKVRFLPAHPFTGFQNFTHGFCVIVEGWRLCPSHLRRNITENSPADIYVFSRFRKELFCNLTKCSGNDLITPGVSAGS